MSDFFDPYSGIYPNSHGGTEQMYDRLLTLYPNIYAENQIVCSRFRSRDLSKSLILWMHDMASDKEAEAIFTNIETLSQARHIIFVSYDQMHHFASLYPKAFDLFMNKFIVIRNFFTKPKYNSISQEKHEMYETYSQDKWSFVNQPRQFVYHTTPHRGLQFLPRIWNWISDTWPDSELHIHSSFGVYGNSKADGLFRDTYDELSNFPNVEIHPTLPPEEMFKHLQTYNYFIYPSIWRETSCLSLIECKYARVFPITTSLGAIPETLSGFGSILPNLSLNSTLKDIDDFSEKVIGAIKDFEKNTISRKSLYFNDHIATENNRRIVALSKWKEIGDNVRS